MPNLQSWLNAWVKVNSKTQGSSASLPAPTNSNGLSPRTHHVRSSSRAGTPGSQTTTTINKAPGGGLLSERSGREIEALSPTRSVSILTDASLHSSGGPTVATSSTTQPPITRYDGAPEVRTSIRKYNSKKQKRRSLHRTNSFSDLIREQARNRSTRSGGKHVSVERKYQPTTTTTTTKQRQRYPPPPETLHHFVEPGESMGGDHLSDGSSVHSISPSETAVTERRSNTHHHPQHESSNIGDYIATNDQQIYVDRSNSDGISVDHSNTALFGVASFFGTEIDERRPTTASSGPRHRTHAAQHGLEDEQPSYLQPFLQDEDPDQFHSLHNPLPSSTAPPSNYTNYNNFINTSTSSSSSTSTRLNHSHYHINTNNSDNRRRLTIHHSDRAYPPLPPYRRTANASSKTAPTNNTSRKVSSQPPPEAAPSAPPPPPPPEEAGLVIVGVRLPFFSRSTPATTPNNSNGDCSTQDSEKDNADSTPFGVGEPNCKGCQVAKAELQCTQESLEYMRTLAIKKEYTGYTCDDCGKSNSTSGSTANRTQTVKKASQQISEVTTRHKKQIEQLINERHNMHHKLDKVSNLSRTLNAETSLRIAESQDLKKELEKVQIERDQMAGELEQLKATVKVYEKEREEHRLVQEKLKTYEDEGLRQAEQAIAQRDDIISKLSSRLATTLDTLALEREQQRQRRQIIFPPTKGQSTESVTNNENEEIIRLREQLAQLESAQLEAKQKETALLFRCETLENQLEKAREPDSKGAPKETHYLSGRNGWEIR